MRSLHALAFRTAIAIAAASLPAAGAWAASTVITHADGSRTEIVSRKGTSQVKTFNKAGKLTGKTLEETPASGGGHTGLIDKYKKAGDTVTTTRGQ